MTCTVPGRNPCGNSADASTLIPTGDEDDTIGNRRREFFTEYDAEERRVDGARRLMREASEAIPPAPPTPRPDVMRAVDVQRGDGTTEPAPNSDELPDPCPNRAQAADLMNESIGYVLAPTRDDTGETPGIDALENARDGFDALARTIEGGASDMLRILIRHLDAAIEMVRHERAVANQPR